MLGKQTLCQLSYSRSGAGVVIADRARGAEWPEPASSPVPMPPTPSASSRDCPSRRQCPQRSGSTRRPRIYVSLISEHGCLISVDRLRRGQLSTGVDTFLKTLYVLIFMEIGTLFMEIGTLFMEIGTLFMEIGTRRVHVTVST